MHPPIGDWDEQYVRSIAASTETANLEKKGSALMDLTSNAGKSRAREELAKQVCAFANAGGGFLAYGIDNSGRLDPGVDEFVNRQSIKAWIEADIPRLLMPAVTNCEAKWIAVPGHHAPGKGVLVVHIPPSESRPHWVPGKPDVPYIRTGEHSDRMSLQTFQDIAFRSITPVGEILSMGKHGAGTSDWLAFRPVVRLVRGPVCPAGQWCLELTVPVERGNVEANWNHADRTGPGKVFLLGTVPLFPGRDTPVGACKLNFAENNRSEFDVTAMLYIGAAPPVERKFRAPSMEPHN